MRASCSAEGAHDQQLGCAFEEVDDACRELAAPVAWRASSRRARRPVNQGTAEADEAESDQQHDAGLREEPPEDRDGARSDKHGHEERLQNPQHNVLQRVDVVDEASHEVAAPEDGDARRCHRFEPLEDTHPEVASTPSAASWPDQSLAVAKEPPRQPEELHADDGQSQRGLRRALCRPGDQPGRGPHEGDGRADAPRRGARPRPTAGGPRRAIAEGPGDAAPVSRSRRHRHRCGQLDDAVGQCGQRGPVGDDHRSAAVTRRRTAARRRPPSRRPGWRSARPGGGAERCAQRRAPGRTVPFAGREPATALAE